MQNTHLLEPIFEVPQLKFMAGAQFILSDDGAEFMDIIKPTSKVDGKCHLRLYPEWDAEMDEPRTFVIVTELPKEQSKISIVAGVECIAGIACWFYEVDPFSLRLIEHHPSEKGEAHDLFYLVHLPWDGEKFVGIHKDRCSRQDVEEMIGGKF